MLVVCLHGKRRDGGGKVAARRFGRGAAGDWWGSEQMASTARAEGPRHGDSGLGLVQPPVQASVAGPACGSIATMVGASPRSSLTDKALVKL